MYTYGKSCYNTLTLPVKLNNGSITIRKPLFTSKIQKAKFDVSIIQVM